MYLWFYKWSDDLALFYTMKCFKFSTKLLWQCDEWLLRGLCEISERSTTSVTSRGCSLVLTNFLSEHEVIKSISMVQSLIMPSLVESCLSVGVATHLWARGYRTIEVSLSSLLLCRSIELNPILSFSYVPLSGGFLDIIAWIEWCLKAWGRKGEF